MLQRCPTSKLASYFLFQFAPTTAVVFIEEHTVLETAGIRKLITINYFNHSYVLLKKALSSLQETRGKIKALRILPNEGPRSNKG